MEIVRIFDDEDCLLSVQYDLSEIDEFSRIFEDWTDIEFLENFFEENKHDLESPFWNNVSIEEAIQLTRNEAIKLRNYFYDLSKKTPRKRILLFADLFKPLEKHFYDADYLARKKAYGLRIISWLRIYALKIGKDMYLITGGTIKLTEKMDDRKHTKTELQKIDYCKQYLKDEGIIDEEGMIELLEL